MESKTRRKELTIHWLKSQNSTKSKYDCSSYGLKHLIESWAGTYISNDNVIEASKLIGLLPKACPKNTNNQLYTISRTGLILPSYKYINISKDRFNTLNKDDYKYKERATGEIISMKDAIKFNLLEE